MPNISSHNEKELLQHIASGDETAYQQIFNKYADAMYANALHFTKSPELAKDLVQEIFIKIWINRQKLLAVDQFDAYLFTVARNLIRNELKKKVLAIENDAFLQRYFADPALTPEEKLQYKQLEEKINLAIRELPPQMQTVFRLSRQEGLTHEQIAQKMGISVVSSKTYMVRALLSIRKQLGIHSARLALLLYFLPRS